MVESNQYEHRAAPTLYTLASILRIWRQLLENPARYQDNDPGFHSAQMYVRAHSHSIESNTCKNDICLMVSECVCVCLCVLCTKSIHAQVLDVYVCASGCECDGPFCVCASHTRKTLCGPSRRCDGNGYGVYGFHRRCNYIECALRWWKQRQHQHSCQMLLLLLDLLFHHLIRFVYVSTAKCMPGCVFFSFFVHSRSLWKWM